MLKQRNRISIRVKEN